MRIAISNSTRSWWGVQQVTDALVRGLAARGHEIMVLCRAGSSIEERMRGFVRTEPVLGGMDFHPRALWLVRRALGDFAPDVLLVTMKKDVRLSAPVARALRIPVVVRHASDRPLRRGWYHRLLYDRLPVHHVVNSRATRDTILGGSPWLRPERVSVVYNGIDAERFDRAAPADIGVPPGGLAIGFVGRFEERKGVLDLADAWPMVASALPAAHLVLVGSGVAEREMRRRLHDQPRVHWLGRRSDIPAVMKGLDIVAMPSHWEGFGLVAAEAMAARRPVVVTNASSLPEIVSDETEGLVVDPRAPDALAAALVRLGSDPELRAGMGAAGRARVERDFPLEPMIEAYEDLLLRASRNST